MIEPMRLDKLSLKTRLVAPVLLGLLTLAVLIPAMPLGQRIPSRDPGVFLYIGAQILDGKVPYRDVWDHKGPVIYYIDALGLLLGRGSEWGVWALQFAGLWSAIVVSYLVLAEAFGRAVAAFASALGLVSLPPVLQDGNYTEQFSLVFQCLALFCFWRALHARRSPVWMGLIGVLLALSFLLRPNNAGLPAVIVALAVGAWLRHRTKKTLADVVTLGLGALTVFLVVGAYFATRGALGALLDNVFVFNSVYTKLVPSRGAYAIYTGFNSIEPTGLALIATAGWIVGCLTLWLRGKPVELGASQRWLLAVALIDLPVEVLLSAASGYTWPHYYLTWIPSSMTLVGFFGLYLLRNLRPQLISVGERHVPLVHLWAAAYLGVVSLLAAEGVVSWLVNTYTVQQPPYHAAVRRIQARAEPTDTLLMWGAEASINYVTGLEAPTRFVYQYPLYTCGYQTPEMVDEFVRAIDQARPIIVDTAASNAWVMPIDPARRSEWAQAQDTCGLVAGMAPALATIEANYRPVEVIEPLGWTVYAAVGGR